MSTLVVLDDGHWLRIDDGGIVGRGSDVFEALPSDEDEIVVGVVAARDAVVRLLDLPGLSDAQATAAARLAIGDQSLSAPELLHVAAGPADEGGHRDVVAVESAKIASRLQALAAVGLDPDRLLAAPLLLPRPEIGFVRATLGQEPIVRGQGTGFLDDPALTEADRGGGPARADRPPRAGGRDHRCGRRARPRPALRHLCQAQALVHRRRPAAAVRGDGADPRRPHPADRDGRGRPHEHEPPPTWKAGTLPTPPPSCPPARL